MGAGSSVSLKKARESEEFAEKVFKDFDTNGDGTLSVIELYDAAVKYGEAIDGEWSLDRIKEALDRFDANGDKKLDLQEFKMALSQLEDKKRSKFKKAGAAVLDKAGTKGNTKLKKALKRSFTWKKDVASVIDAAMDAAEEAEEVAIAGEVDRVYLEAPEVVQLAMPGYAELTLRKTAAFPDLVMWNLGKAKAPTMADLGDGEWQHYLCLEAGAVSKPVSLEPGATWSAAQTFQITPQCTPIE
jgi:hypothetical protein